MLVEALCPQPPVEHLDERGFRKLSRPAEVQLDPVEIRPLVQRDRYVFTWTTEGGPVNFDMHGERPNAGDEFTSYWQDKQQTNGHGSFVAPFAGAHGWY